MNRILNFKSVETATIRISCGCKCGTGFFVNAESGTPLLLTANHIFSESDNKDIVAEIGDEKVKCSIVKRIPESDVAIILPDPPRKGISGLPLLGDMLPYNAGWEAFGYPAQRIDSGARFNGTIARTNEGTKWDVDLNCLQYKNLTEFNGLSGAPLVVNGYVVGVITYDITGGLGACSIFSIQSHLKQVGIKIVVSDKKSVPESIESLLPDTTPNTEVFEKISEVISTRPSVCYFLVSGNPGSGKTTIAAQFDFEQDNFVICDRYFVKVPEQDAVPTQIRATPEYFQRWIEEVYSRVLFSRPPDKPQSDIKVHERLALIQDGISSLGNHYYKAGQIGVLVIDGLDDVPKNAIDQFLSVLPINLPRGLKVIISCTSKNILPDVLQAAISPNDEIKVTPLSIEKAVQFLQEQLGLQEIPVSQIMDLAVKSEGHPLYLRYLSRYVQNLDDVSNLADWIVSIPVINGEIETYYSRVWLQIQGLDAIWIVGTLSRIRIPISKEELYAVLPSSAKYAFPVALPKIEHLLKEDEKVSVYHTSFSDFVNRKTVAIEKDIRDNIGLFCTSQTDTFFTVSEKIYQLANGNLLSRKGAMEACNQNWVDSCVFFGVNPNIVLSDIRLAIAIAAELGLAYKVIELLLLSQRVNFRYNTLFDENATFLANALLALDKHEDALTYVVRNNALVVSDRDALYLLQRFFEYGAHVQAETLLRTIKRTCTTIIEKDLDSETFTRYMHLRFSSVTLSSNIDPKEAFEEFSHIKGVAEEMLIGNGNGKDVIENFKDEKDSYNIGYYIWRHNLPSQIKESEKLMAHVFSDRSSGFTALCIYQAIHFSEISPVRKEKNSLDSWVEDLEYLLDKYGSHVDYHFGLLYVLSKLSKRRDLIENIYSNFFNVPPSTSFRKENGVDLDRRHVETFLLYQECRNYLESPENAPVGLPFKISNWESAIANRFESIGFFFSQARNSEVGDDRYKKLTSLVSDFLPSMIPDLRQRIHWERSYGLPEEIFPLLYDKLTELITIFFPSCIPRLVEVLTSGEYYQLGLYTEGYIDSLLAASRRFMKSSHNGPAFEIAKVLELHVLGTVENRWERNEYLLRLTELYAEIDNFDKAQEMFSQMVNTSMGPSWYKEAQLGIINTAVSMILPQNGEYTYLKKFAGHLDHASGEMTFQRYVKQQQEQFVGDLAKTGSLEKAIEYLKYLLLPDYQTVIANAECGLTDMPNKGDGYVLGARAIEEQAGILDMLRAINVDSSLIVYGITELFILGDDRYISGFSKIQAKILNAAESSDSSKVRLLLKRIVRFYLSELDDQYKTEYITSLASNLCISNLNKLKAAFIHAGIDEVGLNNEDAPDSTISKHGDLIDALPAIKDQVLVKLKSGNKSGARKLIIETLEQVQRSRHGIWSSNYSNEINALRDLLASTYISSREMVTELKALLINEPYFEEWVIADRLIALLQNTTDEEEKQKILSVVENHIYLMVRTPELTIEKYRWLTDEKECSLPRDRSLANLLIWFLNHPSFGLKNRTVEVLAWLGSVEPGLIIPALIDEVTSEGYKLSRELCASILHQITDNSPSAFFEHFEKIETATKDQLLAVRHFMIQNSLFETFEIVRSRTEYEVTRYLDILSNNLNQGRGKGGDVELDEIYLSSFEEHLYKLNGLGVLNKNFAADLFDFIDSERPMTIKDCLRANKYINRSFNNFNDIYLVPDLDNLIRHAINYAILPRLSLTDRNSVADVLRYYQPTFPENRLANELIDERKFETELKKLFVDEEEIDWDCLLTGELFVSYFNSRYSQKNKYYEGIELVAYVVPNSNITERGDDFLPQTFLSNGYPIYSQPEAASISLVIICVDDNRVIGGDIVPSFANLTFFHSQTLSEDDLMYSYWRNGRNWEQQRQGVYQESGYSIRMSERATQTIQKNYTLLWDVYFENNAITVDLFNRKIITR